MDPSEYTAVFAAERNSLDYEKRLPKLYVEMRQFNPFVVTAFEHPERVRLYALAFAAGWISEQNQVATLTLTGKRYPLHQPGEADSLDPLIVGLLEFCQATDETLANAVREAVQAPSRGARKAWRDYYNEWLEARGIPTRFAGLHGAVQDLAAVAALCVYDRLSEEEK